MIAPSPRLDHAGLIAADIKDSFNEWQHSYKVVIADASGVDPANLHFQQKVRIRPELSTRVVDWPLVIYENRLDSFNTRICFAVCTGPTSSKIWSRVSPPCSIDGTVTPITINHLQECHKLYEDISSHSVDWMSPKIPAIVSKYLGDIIVERGRRIDIVILGVNDEYLAEPFIDLSEQEKTIADILADSDFDKSLTSYYRNICNMDVMLSNYIDKSNRSIEPSLFFKLHLPITTTDGYIEHRTVLFLLREKEEYTEIVGLAYDDSAEMDIPLRAGPKLVKIIGHWF